MPRHCVSCCILKAARSPSEEEGTKGPGPGSDGPGPGAGCRVDLPGCF